MSKLLYEAMSLTPEYLSQVTRCEIDVRIPSLNQYITECRRNRYSAAKMKKEVQDDICWYLSRLPKFRNPVFIKFNWIEKNRKRDLDNVCGFGHKVILDALVAMGKLPDDRQKYVKGFCDTVAYGSRCKVIIYIEEVKA